MGLRGHPSPPPSSCSPLFLFLKSVKAKTLQKRRPREAATRWESRYHFSGDKYQPCCTFCLLAPQPSRTRFSTRKGSRLSQDPQPKHSDKVMGSPPNRPSTARVWRAPGSPQSISWASHHDQSRFFHHQQRKIGHQGKTGGHWGSLRTGGRKKDVSPALDAS